MSRQLLCRKCGDKSKHHPDDKAIGFAYRKVYLSCALPEGHGLRVNGLFTRLEELYCDICGEVITGNIVAAVSMWRHEDNTCVMSEWEQDYGNVLTDEAVALADKLVKSP